MYLRHHCIYVMVSNLDNAKLNIIYTHSATRTHNLKENTTHTHTHKKKNKWKPSTSATPGPLPQKSIGKKTNLSSDKNQYKDLWASSSKQQQPAQKMTHTSVRTAANFLQQNKNIKTRSKETRQDDVTTTSTTTALIRTTKITTTR